MDPHLEPKQSGFSRIMAPVIAKITQAFSYSSAKLKAMASRCMAAVSGIFSFKSSKQMPVIPVNVPPNTQGNTNEKAAATMVAHFPKRKVEISEAESSTDYAVRTNALNRRLIKQSEGKILDALSIHEGDQIDPSIARNLSDEQRASIHKEIAWVNDTIARFEKIIKASQNSQEKNTLTDLIKEYSAYRGRLEGALNNSQPAASAPATGAPPVAPKSPQRRIGLLNSMITRMEEGIDPINEANIQKVTSELRSITEHVRAERERGNSVDNLADQARQLIGRLKELKAQASASAPVQSPPAPPVKPKPEVAPKPTGLPKPPPIARRPPKAAATAETTQTEKVESEEAKEASKKAEKYREVVKEITSTEESYLDQLKILQQLKPKVLEDLASPKSAILKNVPNSEKEQIRKALINFFNTIPIDQLVASSDSILKQLKTLDPSKDGPDKYLQVINGFAFDAVSQHAVLWNGALEALTAVNEPLVNMIKEGLPEDKKRTVSTIDGVIITPIQRGPRYVLLMKELNKSVSQGQQPAVIGTIEKKLDEVNQHVAGIERFARSEVLNKFANLGEDERLLFIDGKFVAQKEGFFEANPFRKGRKAMIKLLDAANNGLQAAKTPEHLNEIKAFIDKVESHPWGARVLKADRELGKKFEKLKQDYELKVAKDVMKPILDLQKKLTKPEERDSKALKIRYALMTLVDNDLAAYRAGVGDRAKDILSIDQLVLGYTVSMTTEELFREISAILNPRPGFLPPTVTPEEKAAMQLTMLKLVDALFASPFYRNALVREWVTHPPSLLGNLINGIAGFTSKDPQLSQAVKDLRQTMDESLRKVKTELDIKTTFKTAEAAPATMTAEAVFADLTSQIISNPSAAKSQMVQNLRNLSNHAYSLIDPSQDEKSLFDAAEVASKLSDFVRDHILGEPDLSKRREIYKFYISVAAKCTKDGDYNSAMLIYQALERPQITRLKKTTKNLNDSTSYNELTKLYGPEKNQSTLRQKVASDSQSRLPIPLASKDLRFLIDGNKGMNRLEGGAKILSSVRPTIKPTTVYDRTKFIAEYKSPDITSKIDQRTLQEVRDWEEAQKRGIEGKRKEVQQLLARSETEVGIRDRLLGEATSFETDANAKEQGLPGAIQERYLFALSHQLEA